MKLIDEIEKLVGLQVSLTIAGSKILPFGQPVNGPRPILRNYASAGGYAIMFDELCLTVFNVRDVKSFKVEYQDGEPFSIAWNEYRLVNATNI